MFLVYFLYASFAWYDEKQNAFKMLQIQNCQSCAIQTSIQCIQCIPVTVFTIILVLSDHIGETQVLKSTYIEILHKMFCTSFFSNASENSSKFPWLVERKQDTINCCRHKLVSYQIWAWYSQLVIQQVRYVASVVSVLDAKTNPMRCNTSTRWGWSGPTWLL